MTHTGNIEESNQLMLMGDTDFSGVRIITIDGQPWFVGKDVCRLFGDKNHNRSLSRVEDEDKRAVSLDTKGGRQSMTAVNESGLYSLLLNMRPQRANKNGIPNAYPPDTQERIEKLKAFRRWVTHDVLPCVRKEGRYTTPAERLRSEKYFDQLVAMFMREKMRDSVVWVCPDDENTNDTGYADFQNYQEPQGDYVDRFLDEYQKMKQNGRDSI